MKKILIIEDDEAMRVMLAHFISRSGYEAIPFSSPVEALRVLDSLEADLILTDVDMPGMNGLEFVARLRQAGCDVPVIVLSGSFEEGVEKRAAELGVNRFLRKPVRRLELLAQAIEEELVGTRDESGSGEFDDIRNRFFTEISHEIRTPLTALKLALDELSTDDFSSDGGRKLLSISRRNLSRIISLVESELDKLHARSSG